MSQIIQFHGDKLGDSEACGLALTKGVQVVLSAGGRADSSKDRSAIGAIGQR
jgi:hypothetical protein